MRTSGARLGQRSTRRPPYANTMAAQGDGGGCAQTKLAREHANTRSRATRIRSRDEMRSLLTRCSHSQFRSETSEIGSVETGRCRSLIHDAYISSRHAVVRRRIASPSSNMLPRPRRRPPALPPKYVVSESREGISRWRREHNIYPGSTLTERFSVDQAEVSRLHKSKGRKKRRVESFPQQKMGPPRQTAPSS